MTLATVSQPPVRSTGPRAGRWRFSVDDYLRLHERGIIPEGVRTELIEGEIRVMSPIGSPHISSTLRLIKLLASRVGDRAEVLCQMDVQFGEHTLFLQLVSDAARQHLLPGRRRDGHRQAPQRHDRPQALPRPPTLNDERHMTAPLPVMAMCGQPSGHAARRSGVSGRTFAGQRRLARTPGPGLRWRV